MAEPLDKPDEQDEVLDDSSQEPDVPTTETTTETTGEKADSFDREYVETIRGQAAGYRKRAQAAEEKLKEIEQAQMSELEKVQSQATELATAREQLETQLQRERILNAVTLAATELKFNDPSDALNLIDTSSLTIDEETGKPSAKSVKGALSSLANAKPYLVNAPTQGSADGGARGETTGDLTREQKIAQYEKEVQARLGSVPTPL